MYSFRIENFICQNSRWICFRICLLFSSWLRVVSHHNDKWIRKGKKKYCSLINLFAVTRGGSHSASRAPRWIKIRWIGVMPTIKQSVWWWSGYISILHELDRLVQMGFISAISLFIEMFEGVFWRVKSRSKLRTHVFKDNCKIVPLMLIWITRCLARVVQCSLAL